MKFCLDFIKLAKSSKKKEMKSRFTLTALAYIIPTMILGYVWHLIIFRDLYDELAIYNRTEPMILLGFFSMIIQGVVIAWFYPFYTRGKSSIAKAVLFSLLFGLFLFSVSTLANAAKINVTSMPKWLLIQIGFHLLQFSIAGFFIGIVNRQK
jgi:hypothetical protein